MRYLARDLSYSTGPNTPHMPASRIPIFAVALWQSGARAAPRLHALRAEECDKELGVTEAAAIQTPSPIKEMRLPSSSR